MSKSAGRIIESIFACGDTVADDNVTATEYMIDDGNESEITMDEIMKALKRTKVGKAAVYDRVSSEMLRGGGCIMGSLLHQFFNKCWKSHRVPNDRWKAVIVPLYKGKGSRHVCINYRIISLLRKSLSKKLRMRLKTRFGTYKRDFEKGRVYGPNSERILVSDQKVFSILTDLEKAYDIVKKNYL
ncbi:hypothetical protein EVAR_4679_1 [Eumeta japonica]|uniref:Reverse transcriptase domain-containing protein n=1 Tax=Eumeta variegata TaxID=151549 RepID=A0A4C1WLQ9_EUMVA|nr:hypothetical protein EVAR_4679_1 [Eumeta japonica]